MNLSPVASNVAPAKKDDNKTEEKENDKTTAKRSEGTKET